MADTVQLPPGPELDWEVARRVFGWTAIGVPSIDQVFFYPGPGQGTRHEIPPFSTDIGAAWRLVEQMTTLGWHARLTTPFEAGERWFCGFTPMGMTGWGGRPDHDAGAETMPLAACRAALIAVAAGVNGPLSEAIEGNLDG